MPEVDVMIGGRNFTVACQPGEEQYLRNAAAALDVEASALVAQVGRITEARMLLMAGLILADKTGGHNDQVRALTDRIKALEAELNAARAAPAKTVEIAVIPEDVIKALSDLAEQAEALADQVEDIATR